MPWGKHKDQTLEWVLLHDRSYMQWLATKATIVGQWAWLRADVDTVWSVLLHLETEKQVNSANTARPS
jgi:hypothetical protein